MFFDSIRRWFLCCFDTGETGYGDGMQVPCTLHFTGRKKFIDILKRTSEYQKISDLQVNIIVKFLTFFPIGLPIQQNHKNCHSPVLWHSSWLSLLSGCHLWECFDHVLTKAMETQHCKTTFSRLSLFARTVAFQNLKYFSLILSHVEIVLCVGPCFKKTSLFDSSFLMSLSALYYSFSDLAISSFFYISKSIADSD